MVALKALKLRFGPLDFPAKAFEVSRTPEMGDVGVSGLGFKFRVKGLGFGVLGLGFEALGLKF